MVRVDVLALAVEVEFCTCSDVEEDDGDARVGSKTMNNSSRRPQDDARHVE
jgi:hypothetical protein